MKVTLKILLALSAAICLICFPWAILPWDITEYAVNQQNEIKIGSDNLSIFLYRFQCLFFIFFAAYFSILFCKTTKYKPVISIASFLIIFMGLYMHWLKHSSQLNNFSSCWEPAVWVIVGLLIRFLNFKSPDNDNAVIKSSASDREVIILRILSIILIISLITIPFIPDVWDALSNDIQYTGLSPFSKYAIGLILSFLGFSSVIIWYISDKTQTYKELYLLIIIVLLTFPLIISVWNICYRIYNILIGSLALLAFIMGIALQVLYRNKPANQK